MQALQSSGGERDHTFCRGGRVKIRVSCIGAAPCFCAAPRAIKSLTMRGFTDEKAIYSFPELLEKAFQSCRKSMATSYHCIAISWAA